MIVSDFSDEKKQPMHFLLQVKVYSISDIYIYFQKMTEMQMFTDWTFPLNAKDVIVSLRYVTNMWISINNSFSC